MTVGKSSEQFQLLQLCNTVGIFISSSVLYVHFGDLFKRSQAQKSIEISEDLCSPPLRSQHYAEAAEVKSQTLQ